MPAVTIKKYDRRFEKRSDSLGGMPYLCLNRWNKYCIPYNKDTAHLIGTIEDCPIDYEIEFSKEFKEE